MELPDYKSIEVLSNENRKLRNENERLKNLLAQVKEILKKYI